ncbi:VanW family protein [Patescibacteria group bacterium]|nr:VanW family protein [Patescibacteria group bacterium]
MKKIAIIFLVILIGLISSTFTLQIINQQKIAYGIKIGGFEIDAREPQAAAANLENRWNEFAEQEIDFIFQEKKWSSKISDLGFEIDSQTTIEQAKQIGNRSNFFYEIKEQFFALVGRENIPVRYKINEEKFIDQTKEIFKEIEKPATDASIFFNEEIDDFSLKHSSDGTVIEREQLLNDLLNQFQSFSSQSIELKLLPDEPEVKNDETGLVLEKAQLILANQPYSLIFENSSWTIGKEIIIDWLEFSAIKEENSDNQILGIALDKDKIEKYLNSIAKTIDRPAADAQLETEENKAIIFVPAQEGFAVKKSQTIERLIANILSDPPVKKTTIIADKASPKITLEKTNQLGVNALVGQGTSNFAGSPNNRIHNIKTGATKFNGLILTPGEEFSFNNLLGGSGAEQGFLPELVIKNYQTIPEYGGGLCQISTTFFRAAVNSGLKITERKAHAFPVVYYSPQGFDATIYEPKPDLRFINNTPSHLLIQTAIEGTKLTINFYATDDGRKVKIDGPYTLEKKENGSMKAVLTQKVYDANGEITEEQIFYSNYNSPNAYTTPTN